LAICAMSWRLRQRLPARATKDVGWAVWGVVVIGESVMPSAPLQTMVWIVDLLQDLKILRFP